MKDFNYVYILVSEADSSRYYTGMTGNLTSRLRANNAGQVPYTAKHRPRQTETAIAFRSRQKALDLQRYLKTHSGRAFASKHFRETD